MKHKPLDVQLSFENFHIQSINEASGVFFDGPHRTNHWRSTHKINQGLRVSEKVSLKNSRSVLKDNDHLDFI